MARVTLADVAAVVGVSAKTVSNVVNGTGWVSDDMRARILAAIRELDYRPNLAARQLRGGSSGLLALAVPDLREPYFAEFAAQFVATAVHVGEHFLHGLFGQLLRRRRLGTGKPGQHQRKRHEGNESTGQAHCLEAYVEKRSVGAKSAPHA